MSRGRLASSQLKPPRLYYIVFMSISLSFRTEEETKQALERIAERLDRNRNWIINHAIQNFIDQQAWEEEQIEKGIADRKAGRTLSHKEMMSCFKKNTSKNLK
jgi:predicted transcriptional regulator